MDSMIKQKDETEKYYKIYTDNKLQINHTLTQIHKALRYDKKKIEKIMMNKKNRRLCFFNSRKNFGNQ